MRRLLLAALILAAYGLGVLSAGLYGPRCPSEDSCYPDYHGGSWHIIEGERP